MSEDKIAKPDAEWRAALTPERFRIARVREARGLRYCINSASPGLKPKSEK